VARAHEKMSAMLWFAHTLGFIQVKWANYHYDSCMDNSFASHQDVAGIICNILSFQIQVETFNGKTVRQKAIRQKPRVKAKRFWLS